MILITIIVIPIVAAAVAALDRRVAPGVTVAAALAAFALSVHVGLTVAAGGNASGIPGWIGADGLSTLLLLLISFVGATGAVFSIGYMARTGAEGRLRGYYASYNLFLGSILAVPLLAELSMVWIAVELTTLFSVFLVGYAGDRPALEAAWKYAVLTLMGAAIALLGFLILFWGLRAAGGSAYTWDGVRSAVAGMPPALLGTAFLLILVGFGTKVGLVPLHTWLPDAHSQAPTPVCLLLSGVETSAVLYVILRLIPLAGGVHAGVWAQVFGLISVGAAAFLLLQVRDYKRLFAFSTVEHMGIILTAAGFGSAGAAYGAVYQLLAHAVTKSFAFLAAGLVLLAVGTREIERVRGLIRRSPLAGAAVLIGGLAIAGAPPFVVFLSEFSIMRAGIAAGDFLAVGLLALFVAIAFVGIMWHVARMAFGQPSEGMKPARLPVSARIAAAIAGIPVIVLGVYLPGPLHALLRLAAEALSR